MSTNSGNATLDELRAEVETLQDDLFAVTDTLRRLASGAGQRRLARIREASALAGRQVAEASATAERAIADRPLTSAVIAFGIGFLLSRLLFSR